MDARDGGGFHANGTVTTMSNYDPQNRPANVTYTPGASTGITGYSVTATPGVTYSYDTCFKGELCSVSTSASGTTYSYDGFGRIATSTQTTGSNGPYTFTYGYSLTDQLTSMIYPVSGHQVTYGLDSADRVTSIQNVSAGNNYAQSLSYTADGGLMSATLGTGLTQSLTWNDRIQPTGVAVNNAGSQNLLTLGLFPCAGAATSCSSGNNGNLQSQTIAMPGLNLTQSYSYDHLNRLTGASETGGSGWAQAYGYDSFGNRWIGANTNLPTLSLETPTTSSWYSSTVPNRIVNLGNPWSYDNTGNVVQVGGMARSFTYDGENREVTADLNGAIANYVYDGNGLRVQKTFNGVTTTYAYDAWGNLAAEYSTGTETSPCGVATCYVTQDHLGSARLITDGAGSTTPPSTIARYDYQPFGPEIGATYDGRTTALGYLSAPDGVTEKFTGQARDPEMSSAAGVSMDWYRARYMSGAQGRFQGADPGNAGADASDPQTWNGYSYVGNNPLSFTDPDGMSTANGGGDDGADGGGLIVAAIVAIGDAIANVFSGGPPPTISYKLATPSSPVLGTGNPGLFVSNWNSDDVLASMPQIPQSAVDAIAGAGDDLSFGMTSWVRRRMGTDGEVNRSSKSYSAGGWAGMALSVAIGAGTVAEASKLPKMTVAIGKGEPKGIHFAYEVAGKWFHGAETEIPGQITITEQSAAAWARRFAKIKIPIPVRSAEAAASVCGTSVSNCASAVWTAFWKGWGF